MLQRVVTRHPELDCLICWELLMQFKLYHHMFWAQRFQKRWSWLLFIVIITQTIHVCQSNYQSFKRRENVWLLVIWLQNIRKNEQNLPGRIWISWGALSSRPALGFITAQDLPNAKPKLDHLSKSHLVKWKYYENGFLNLYRQIFF